MSAPSKTFRWWGQEWGKAIGKGWKPFMQEAAKRGVDVDEWAKKNPELAKKLGPKPKPPSKEAIRRRMVAAAMLSYRNRDRIAYSQRRPISGIRPPIRPPKYPLVLDCSGHYTWCALVGGSPDPNGNGWSGYGYTGTQIVHGRRIAIGAAKPGDAVFYGRSGITHVVIVVDGGKIVSHGQSSGPTLYSTARYRSDARYAHTYL